MPIANVVDLELDIDPSHSAFAAVTSPSAQAHISSKSAIFSHAGNVYSTCPAVGSAGASPPNPPAPYLYRVYKSTDGITFVVKDNANGPTALGVSVGAFCLSGSIIHFVINSSQTSAPQSLRLGSFDMSSDTFSVIGSASGNVINTPSNDPFLVRTPGGDSFVVAHVSNNSGAGPFQPCYIRNISGVWDAAPTTIMTALPNPTLGSADAIQSVLIDGSGNFHILLWRYISIAAGGDAATRLYYIRVDSSGSVGIPALLDTQTTIDFKNFISGQSVVFGGNIMFPIVNLLDQTVSAWVGNSATNPTVWNKVAIDTGRSTVPTDAVATYPTFFINPANGNLHCYWLVTGNNFYGGPQGASTADGLPQRIYRSVNTGSGWGVPSAVYDLAVNFPTDGSSYDPATDAAFMRDLSVFIDSSGSEYIQFGYFVITPDAEVEINTPAFAFALPAIAPVDITVPVGHLLLTGHAPSFTLLNPPRAACPLQLTGTVGIPYASSVTVSGGTAPFTFALISGALPPGLALNAATGAITGTPTTAGSFTFVVRVTDVNGNTAVTPGCPIVISASASKCALQLTSDLNPTTVGQPVTLIAFIQPTTLAGHVHFFSDGVEIGAGNLVNGQASLIISTLTPGAHIITAQYRGGA